MIASYAPSLIGFRKDLISTLQSKGFVVYAAAPGLQANSELRQKLEAKGVVACNISLQRTGLNPLADLRSLLILWQLIRHVKPQYVLSYTIKPVIYGSIAACLAGVKNRIALVEGLGFVFTSTTMMFSPKRQLLKFLVQIFYKLGLSFATRTIFLNVDDQSEFVRLGLVAERKTFMLGGIGVDLSLWPKSAPVIDPITFLFVGRLLREKGIEEFVKAAKILKLKHSNLRFIVLGDLDENPGAIAIDAIKNLVNEHILEWYGHVEVQPWMKRTSVFVLPSYREGVPASTQEAMAMGRPIVTTDVPGCRETVVDGDNGFIVPVQDVDALAEAMLRFVADPELIVRMGDRSRVIAEEKYDVHKVNAVLLHEIGIRQ